MCDPACPVPAAWNNERVQTGGVCLVTVTAVVLMPLNLTALLTRTGSVTLGGCSQKMFLEEQVNAGGEAESGLAWSQPLSLAVRMHREQLWNK